MIAIKRKQSLLIILVCVVGIFVTGCSLILDDGEDRHLLKASGEISILGGSTNTRLVTNKTEETTQASKKPSVREAEVQKALIKDGLGNRVADAMEQ